MKRELSPILGQCAALLCKVRRMVADAETRASGCAPIFAFFKYLPIKFPLQRHPDYSARDPNLGGLVQLDIPIAHLPAVLEQ
jgi:hypothetical protein